MFKLNVDDIDKDLIKSLDSYKNYINEYNKILTETFYLVLKDINDKNKKEKNFRRLSELLIIIEFLESYNLSKVK